MIPLLRQRYFFQRMFIAERLIVIARYHLLITDCRFHHYYCISRLESRCRFSAMPPRRRFIRASQIFAGFTLSDASFAIASFCDCCRRLSCHFQPHRLRFRFVAPSLLFASRVYRLQRHLVEISVCEIFARDEARGHFQRFSIAAPVFYDTTLLPRDLPDSRYVAEKVLSPADIEYRQSRFALAAFKASVSSDAFRIHAAAALSAAAF